VTKPGDLDQYLGAVRAIEDFWLTVDAYAAAPVVPLQAGDVVLLLTDGVLDARNPAGVRFGWPRVEAAIRRHRGAPPPEMVAALYTAVRDFIADCPAEDDMTAIVIQVEQT
jgi:serine phosphatase RsbU (regulator of sigma subunit)